MAEELGFHGSLAWMAVLTIFISIFSEYLVEAIEPTSRDWGVPYLFIGVRSHPPSTPPRPVARLRLSSPAPPAVQQVILIPIVGNAAEHATAVVMAYKDKMEITMGVAVGSSVQVAVFVIPFMVVSAWLFDIPLDLNFHPFETATVFLSVIIVNVVIANGNSTYLEGIMLLLLYIFISAGFIMHDPEEAHCTQNQLCGWEDLACLGTAAPLAPRCTQPWTAKSAGGVRRPREWHCGGGRAPRIGSGMSAAAREHAFICCQPHFPSSALIDLLRHNVFSHLPELGQHRGHLDSSQRHVVPGTVLRAPMSKVLCSSSF